MNHGDRLETSLSSISGWYLSQNLKTVPGNINLGAKETFPRDVPRTTTQTSDIAVILDHQRTMTTRFAILLLAALSAAVMAAPGMIEPAHAVAHRSTPTTCATGAAASVSGYVLNYTAVEDTAAGNRFYDIEPGFSTDHSVGSAMVSHTPPPSPPPLTPPFPYLLCCVYSGFVLTASPNALEPVHGAWRRRERVRLLQVPVHVQRNARVRLLLRAVRPGELVVGAL